MWHWICMCSSKVSIKTCTHTYLHAYTYINTYQHTCRHTDNDTDTETNTHTGERHTFIDIDTDTHKRTHTDMYIIVEAISKNLIYFHNITKMHKFQGWYSLAGTNKRQHISLTGVTKRNWDAKTHTFTVSPYQKWHILAVSYLKMKHLGSKEPRY